ncbi:MAG: OmpA family protein [Cyanobacteria bacterium]|nr:OmpA family protein [Cyanobacteriota bacterium]
MGRKKKHEEHENLERWLVSYADFITLLFATFTALYAISTADLAKLKDVAKSIRDGFQQQSLISGIQSVLQGKSPPSASTGPSNSKGEGDGLLGKHESLTYTKGETKNAEKTVAELQQSVEAMNKEIAKKLAAEGKGSGKTGGKAPGDGKGKGEGKGAGEGGTKNGEGKGQGQGKNSGNSQGDQAAGLGKGLGLGEGGKGQGRGIELAVQERGIRISFDSSLMFEAGSASLKEESKQALDKIAENIKSMSETNFIHIEGHTDNQKMVSAIYPSNWELSSARSCTVIRYLIDHHDLRADHLAAVGYGDTRPFTTNLTPQGRARNRRIDIIIYGQKTGDTVNVKKQYLTESTLVKSVDSGYDKQIIIKNSEAPSEGASGEEGDSTSGIPNLGSRPKDKYHFDPFIPSSHSGSGKTPKATPPEE